jgi:hypothetical protein
MFEKALVNAQNRAVRGEIGGGSGTLSSFGNDETTEHSQ